MRGGALRNVSINVASLWTGSWSPGSSKVGLAGHNKVPNKVRSEYGLGVVFDLEEGVLNVSLDLEL